MGSFRCLAQPTTNRTINLKLYPRRKWPILDICFLSTNSNLGGNFFDCSSNLRAVFPVRTDRKKLRARTFSRVGVFFVSLLLTRGLYRRNIKTRHRQSRVAVVVTHKRCLKADQTGSDAMEDGAQHQLSKWALICISWWKSRKRKA